MDELPRCGLYRTRGPVGAIPAGRLVYFHNHGDPGPGLYLPESWRSNRARFEARGHLLGDPANAKLLEPLLAEGFYRVLEPFYCCDKQCRLFTEGAMVQLGYDGAGTSILFVPELVEDELHVPTEGTKVERDRLRIQRLIVQTRGTPQSGHADDPLLH